MEGKKILKPLQWWCEKSKHNRAWKSMCRYFNKNAVYYETCLAIVGCRCDIFPSVFFFLHTVPLISAWSCGSFFLLLLLLLMLKIWHSDNCILRKVCIFSSSSCQCIWRPSTCWQWKGKEKKNSAPEDFFFPLILNPIPFHSLPGQGLLLTNISDPLDSGKLEN